MAIKINSFMVAIHFDFVSVLYVIFLVKRADLIQKCTTRHLKFLKLGNVICQDVIGYFSSTNGKRPDTNSL